MQEQTFITIAGRPIGTGYAPYVVAELSGNHNGDIKRAFALMDAAKKAGADAVKLQTYTADTITMDHDSPDFRVGEGLWAGRTLYELYQEAHTPWEWHESLFEHGREIGIPVFSTPFDSTAVELLERLETPAYKIASFELIDLPLVELVARTGKPLIMSTGMATVDEIGEAVDAARGAGARNIILLHCVSGYPTPVKECHLTTIPDLATRFGCAAGLSDHTMGTTVALAAVALGAVFIEKHFTLRRSDGGPDAAFSLEPEELGHLVSGTRDAWQALGRPNYTLTDSEKSSALYRRSLYAVADIRAGEMITPLNVRSIRPGFGMLPKELPRVLGKKAVRDIPRGTALKIELIE